MFDQCDELSRNLSISFRNIISTKDLFREKLGELEYLRNDSDLDFNKTHPTACGIDGSFTIENLLSIDILAIAGVAVEGLTPPTNIKHWPRPRHRSKIYTVTHSDSTRQIAGAIMMTMELELATKAPHDVVFLDGSLSTPLVHFRKALGVIDRVPENLKDAFLDRLPKAIDNYRTILEKKTKTIYVGVPKYTTRKEICKLFNLFNYEDRGVLSFVLEEGEFIIPKKMDVSHEFLEIPTKDYRKSLEYIANSLTDSYVIYYRPCSFFPVIRLELMKNVANDLRKLSSLFETLRMQCNAPGIFEPFPLYLADRMVKHLRIALPALRKAATQTMTRQWTDKISNIYLAMHSYRSKWG